MTIIAQLAQEHTALYTYGPLGVFCCWFMWRFEDYKKQARSSVEETNKEIRVLSHRIDGMTRAMWADMIDRDSTGPHARKFAEEMLSKIEPRDSIERSAH